MIEEIRKNLFRVELPLPLVLSTINVYIIKGKKRSLIIDTGMNSEDCLNALLNCLSQLKIDMETLDLFITHFHIDHFGNVKTLLKPQGKLYIHSFEWDSIRRLKEGLRRKEIEKFLLVNGFPKENTASLFADSQRIDAAYSIEDPNIFTFIQDGDHILVEDYEFLCINTPGHTKGHLTLFDIKSKILISGDHLLADITPSIQARSFLENPLEAYLSSLRKIYDLPVEYVLPSHGRCFRDHRKRIEELWTHHRLRLNEIISVLKEGKKHAYEIASKMTWNIDCKGWDSFPLLQKLFAVGEAVAHLRYLEEKGKVTCEKEDVFKWARAEGLEN